MADEHPHHQHQEHPTEKVEEPVEASETADETEVSPESHEHHHEAKPGSKFERFKLWYVGHKKISIPLSVLLVLFLLIIIPFTRYAIFGVFMSKDYHVHVSDSKTNLPVSSASVTMGDISAETDGVGVAVLHGVKVGNHTALVTKKYYKDSSLETTVPILDQKSTPNVTLTATGRQVKINVLNTISKKTLPGVTIKVAGTEAQTDASGSALVVLPPGVAEQQAELSLDGYNTATLKVKVSEQKVEENNFTLTPAGKVYFLSKRTGKIDLMKSNLDGTEQKVVVAGTGKESESDTILLVSRDWKYLAFKSKRDDSPAKIYWMDTSVDKLNVLDEGDADFTMIGWANNTFVYQVNRNNVADWQPNRQALKSFNAGSAKLIVLNQTSAAGTGQNNYAFENYDTNNYLIEDKLLFSKTWQHYYNSPDLIKDKQAGIYTINVDGTGFKNLKGFTYTNNDYLYLTSILYEPKEIYYNAYIGDTNKYFKYEDGSVTADEGIKDAYDKFTSTTYPTYLLSPSGKQTFWVEPRDGKSNLFVGDDSGQNEKTIAKLGDEFQNYGYYTDEYMLVSKKSSELYALPSSGVKSEAELIKITDYHKPAYNFYGYGGGYGGQ